METSSTTSQKATRNAKSSSKTEKKLADRMANQLLEKYNVSRKERQEVSIIMGILLDSGLSIEERIKKIGRAPASGLFVDIVKRSVIEFATKHKELLENRRGTRQEKLNNNGILSIALSDFFDNKISIIAKHIESRVNKDVRSGQVDLESEEKTSNREKKKVEEKTDRASDSTQHRQITRKKFNIKAYLKNRGQAIPRASQGQELSYVARLKRSRQNTNINQSTTVPIK